LGIQTAFPASVAQVIETRIEGSWLAGKADPRLLCRPLEPGRRPPACKRNIVNGRRSRHLAAEQVNLQPNAVVVKHGDRDEIDDHRFAETVQKPGDQRRAIAVGLRHVVGDQPPNTRLVQPGTAEDGAEVVGDDIGLCQQITGRLHPRARSQRQLSARPGQITPTGEHRVGDIDRHFPKPVEGHKAQRSVHGGQNRMPKRGSLSSATSPGARLSISSGVCRRHSSPISSARLRFRPRIDVMAQKVNSVT